jgi:GTP:adenosylcobinamide-phosphate guanylyltransferase
MQGEKIETTYRELCQLKLIDRYINATQIDSDEVYANIDKRIVLTDDILKKMGLN